jgi:hypothetical protein
VTGEVTVYDAATNMSVDSFYVGPRLEGMHVTRAALYLLSAEGLFRVPLDVVRSRAGARGAG